MSLVHFNVIHGSHNYNVIIIYASLGGCPWSICLPWSACEVPLFAHFIYMQLFNTAPGPSLHALLFNLYLGNLIIYIVHYWTYTEHIHIIIKKYMFITHSCKLFWIPAYYNNIYRIKVLFDFPSHTHPYHITSSPSPGCPSELQPSDDRVKATA